MTTKAGSYSIKNHDDTGKAAQGHGNLCDRIQYCLEFHGCLEVR